MQIPSNISNLITVGHFGTVLHLYGLFH